MRLKKYLIGFIYYQITTLRDSNSLFYVYSLLTLIESFYRKNIRPCNKFPYKRNNLISQKILISITSMLTKEYNKSEGYNTFVDSYYILE